MRSIQSVERAMQILFHLAANPSRQLGVSEISEALQLHQTTVWRLLATLKKIGIVVQDPVAKTYGLGVRALELAHAVTSQLDIVNVARPHMAGLVVQMKESTYMVVLDGIYSVTVAQVTATSRVNSARPSVGRRFRAHATSGGKLLLAYSPTEVAEELIKKGLKQYAPNTITNPRELLAELEKIREQGYSISNQEVEVGLLAVAVGIRAHSNDMVAAVSISGPVERLTSDGYLSEFITGIRETAREISFQLGWKE